MVLIAPVACRGAPTTKSVEDVAAQIDADLDSYLERADPYGQVRAVLVLHDGEPVLERYTGATADDYWGTQSITKSVMSALVGLAIEQGYIEGVEQTLGELLPAYRGVMTPDVAAITLRKVLTHTAGFAPGSTTLAYWESPDWVGAIIADRVRRSEPAAGSFAYSDPGAHLLSAVIAEATGEPVLQFARSNLFDRLDIRSEPAFEALIPGPDSEFREEFVPSYNDAEFAWPVDPQGYPEGSGLLKLQPQDLAAIGQTYLDAGRWNGEQVIPASWVRESTTTQVESSGAAEDYGYMWWVTNIDDDPAFIARGRGGQMVAVIPDRQLVVVLATEFDLSDPLANNKAVSDGAAIEAVRRWIAPHFPSG